MYKSNHLKHTTNEADEPGNYSVVSLTSIAFKLSERILKMSVTNYLSAHPTLLLA